MNIVAVTCIKNEADIIEALVRHTLRVVDRLIVLDDGSRDDSPKILRALVDEGLPLEVIERQSLRKDQRERMTRLVCDEAGQRLQADWIFVLDADEFLCVTPGESLIPPGTPDDACLMIPWRGHVALPCQDLQEPNPALRLRHRRQVEPHPTFKVVVPGKLARQAGGKVEQGNHRYWIDDQPLEAKLLTSAWLAHLPLRSPAQFLMRIVGTTLSYLAMPDRNPDWGWSCREPLERLKLQPETLESEFYEASRLYGIPHAREQGLLPELIEEPVGYLGGPLKYTGVKSPGQIPAALEALPVLIRMAEDYALRLAVLTSPLSEVQATEIEERSQILATLQSTLVARDQERSRLVGQGEQFRSALESCGREIAQARDDLRLQQQRHEQDLAAIQASCDRQVAEAQAEQARQLAEAHVIAAEQLAEARAIAAQQLADVQAIATQEVADVQTMTAMQLAEVRRQAAEDLAALQQAVETSWTWRSGRIVGAPARVLRAAAGRLRLVPTDGPEILRFPSVPQDRKKRAA